ncbi:winged helix DNA-binding domain-containing protein [Flavobacterium cerinum]|uniref:Winged helix DNA-binding domain-containing protein n=1 Tax=Flavobacterium cerinum TaxID=2502784 RepID=A0A444HC42_9FLAO|nr:winged helix DNA-binding domain-containing protein [Flavobacterium cerinum]RWX01029.1 winged helix DNA-binding domain-containing protein [Flavobacterium cerinum]
MSPEEIRLRRQYNQKLLQSDFTTPEQVVSYMAGMQAQEYAMAKWAVALRMQETVESEVEKAFNDGRILRTHLLRSTWHFVTQEDIRWMLDITAPRVITTNAFMYRKCELDSALFNKCNTILEQLLRDNNYLSRDSIKTELANKGIEGDGLRISLIMMQAELEGLICSGPRQGNQFTYALIDERAPNAKRLSGEEALRELCLRYFKSRGPASLKDFTTWSSLTVKDAKDGLGMIAQDFEKTTIEGVEYYYLSDMPPMVKKQFDFLMPDYDEYGMGYKDRSVLLEQGSAGNKNQFDRVIIVNGMIAGSWKRTLKKNSVLLDLQLFKPHKATDRLIVSAIEKYSKFLGRKVELV